MKSTRKTEDIHGKHFSSIGEDLLRTQFMEKRRENSVVHNDLWENCIMKSLKKVYLEYWKMRL